MRIVVVGGGGLGTVLAGYLARSSVDVSLLVKPSQVAAYDQELVRIEGVASFTAPVRILSAVPEGMSLDYLLLCVKARDTEAALAPLRQVSLGAAVSLQNGVAKDEALARYLGADHVVGGLTYIAGTLLAPGRARATNPAGTFFGELDGRISERVEQLVTAFQAAGLPAASERAIVTHEWYKLAIFLRTALVSALTRLDVGALAAQAPLRGVCAAVAHEVVRVAAAEGYDVPRHASQDFSLAGPPTAEQSAAAADATEGEMAAVLDAVGNVLRATGRSFYPSLAQDIMAARPTELETTAGDVLARADRHGLQVPVLRTCTELLRGIDPARDG